MASTRPLSEAASCPSGPTRFPAGSSTEDLSDYGAWTRRIREWAKKELRKG